MLTDYLDVVMEYSYGRSDHRVEERAWGPEFHDAVVEAGKNSHILKQMFFIYTIMASVPEKLAFILPPSFKLIFRIRRVRLSPLCTVRLHL